LPTRYDPFANVVLEALASGLPVLTSTENGAAETFQQAPHDCGFALPVTTAPDVWATTACQMLNCTQRENLRNRCRMLAEKFDSSSHIRKVLEMIDLSHSTPCPI